MFDIEQLHTGKNEVKFFVKMSDYDQQKWFDLYKTALLELERAAMTGRISDARGEIATRLETLKLHPELHRHESQAIQDALRNLRVLEQEEERLAADEKRRLLQETVKNLQTLAPKFGELSQDEE